MMSKISLEKLGLHMYATYFALGSSCVLRFYCVEVYNFFLHQNCGLRLVKDIISQEPIRLT